MKLVYVVWTIPRKGKRHDDSKTHVAIVSAGRTVCGLEVPIHSGPGCVEGFELDGCQTCFDLTKEHRKRGEVVDMRTLHRKEGL